MAFYVGWHRATLDPNRSILFFPIGNWISLKRTTLKGFHCPGCRLSRWGAAHICFSSSVRACSCNLLSALLRELYFREEGLVTFTILINNERYFTWILLKPIWSWLCHHLEHSLQDSWQASFCHREHRTTSHWARKHLAADVVWWTWKDAHLNSDL